MQEKFGAGTVSLNRFCAGYLKSLLQSQMDGELGQSYSMRSNLFFIAGGTNICIAMYGLSGLGSFYGNHICGMLYLEQQIRNLRREHNA